MCDPGVSDAAQKLLEGRISEILMNKFHGWELVRTGVPHKEFSENIIHSDEWYETLTRTKPKLWNEEVCTEHALAVEYGIEHEK